MPRAVGTHILNLVRGALIGIAEVVPGISGGTVALITGVYESLITSAGHVLSGVKLLVADLPRGRGPARARAEFARAHWGVILAVLAGMVTAALIAARVLAPVVENHQQYAFAVFFGLVLASLWVPYSLSGRRWGPVEYLLAAAAAAVSFTLTGLPQAETEARPLFVLFAASIAICALVVPGVSGAFILQALGLYTPTMQAVNERDLGYIGIFALGAVLGLVLFVKLLQWLLENHRRITLVVITGLMLGALRALWPWQSEDRTILPPTDVPVTVSLIAAGFALVVAVILIERGFARRSAKPDRETDGEPVN